MSVAVLLDKFITATVDMESEQQQQEKEEIKRKKEVHSPPSLLSRTIILSCIFAMNAFLYPCQI